MIYKFRFAVIAIAGLAILAPAIVAQTGQNTPEQIFSRPQITIAGRRVCRY